MKKPKLIFRLLLSNGEGIYRHLTKGAPHRLNPFLDASPEQRFHYMIEEPDPAHDWLRTNAKDPWGFEVIGQKWRQGFHIFGFSSLVQARAWFNSAEDLRAFTREGVKLKVLLGEDVISFYDGRAQCMFHPLVGARHVEFDASVLYDLDGFDALALAQLEAMSRGDGDPMFNPQPQWHRSFEDMMQDLVEGDTL